MFFAFMPNYKGIKKTVPTSIITLFIFVFIFILLILRDINAPSDMVNYSWMFIQASDFQSAMSQYHGNIFFSFLMYIGNFISLDKETYFYILSLLFLVIYAVGLKLIFKNSKHYLLALSFFAISSTFVLLFTNVIRQGLALSLLVLAIGLLLSNKKLLATLILVCSIFSHFSILPIVTFILLIKYILNKNKLIFIFLLAIPLLPILGSFLLGLFASLGGLFNKIESFGSKDYNNTLVYIKVVLLYMSAVLFYIYGKKYLLFNNINYKYIYMLYLLILGLIFFTLPVLLLSSRFLYYASGLMPILFASIFYSRQNIININYRYLIFIGMSITYGYVVYSFPSTKLQLGF
jgi:hypothetical protein